MYELDFYHIIVIQYGIVLVAVPKCIYISKALKRMPCELVDFALNQFSLNNLINTAPADGYFYMYVPTLMIFGFVIYYMIVIENAPRRVNNSC